MCGFPHIFFLLFSFVPWQVVRRPAAPGRQHSAPGLVCASLEKILATPVKAALFLCVSYGAHPLVFCNFNAHISRGLLQSLCCGRMVRQYRSAFPSLLQGFSLLFWRAKVLFFCPGVSRSKGGLWGSREQCPLRSRPVFKHFRLQKDLLWEKD